MQILIASAPIIIDHLDEESEQHFTQLKSLLDAMDISYTINPRLVRGLDYYSKTVFEWTTNELGSQGTVCGGGRYDGLVEQLGSKATPACGFGMGIERVLGLMEAQGITLPVTTPEFYMIMAGDAAQQVGMQFAEQLRNKFPQLYLICNGGGGSFKAQMKRADKSAAKYALIIGENELKDDSITLKPMRDRDAQQLTLPQAELVEYIHSQIMA